MRGLEKKKFICFGLMIGLVLFTVFQPVKKVYAAYELRNTTTKNQIKSTDNYHDNWLYWAQGGSRYGMMGLYGCHVVAYAKLLKESGCPLPDSFDPDDLYIWGRSTSYNGNTYLTSTMLETNVAGRAKMPCKFAEVYGFDLELAGTYIITGLSESKKVDKVMEFINQGYYVVLGCGEHFTYIAREESLKRGTPIISDSWGKYSWNTLALVEYRKYSTVWADPPSYDAIFYYKTGSSNPVYTPTPTFGPEYYSTVGIGRSASETTDRTYMTVGETVNFGFYGAKGYNRETDRPTISWKSSNPNVATVSTGGAVKAVKAGSCDITLTVLIRSTRTQYTGRMTVTVANPATPTPTPKAPIELILGLSDGSSEITLYEGDTFDLDNFNIESIMENPDSASISWKSPRPDVVSVDENNVATANKAGVCYLKCETVDQKSGQEYVGKAWINVIKATTEVVLSRMDNITEMSDYMLKSAEYDDQVIPDFTYDSKVALLAKGVADINEISQRDSAVIAVPVTWSIEDVKDILNSDLLKDYMGEAVNVIKHGRIKVKKDEKYYYIFGDFS